jgi:NAD(P)-dependent dehydrogenase (short-subunit alcohol dehydrogenase family)
MIGSIPLGRFAEPEDVADAVLFLLSERRGSPSPRDVAYPLLIPR